MNDYFSFTGRIRRLKYGFALLILVMISFLSWLIVEYTGEPPLLGWIIAVLAWLAFSPVIIKRSHDVDLSGWSILLLFIPFANVIFLFYLLIKEGTQGTNRFGPDPRRINRSLIN